MTGTFDRGQAEEFFDYVFGNDSGYLAIALGHDGHINEAGKWDHQGRWSESFYEYPNERKLALDNIGQVIDSGDRVDVYVCPYLRTERKRRAGNAVAHKLLHADYDGGPDHATPLDMNAVRTLGALVVSSGTPGHAHVYARLSDDTGAAHGQLGRAFVKYLRADPGKWQDNDVLRLPGTINYKNCDDHE